MAAVTKEDLQKLPSAFLADNSSFFENVASQETITPESQNKEGGMFLSTQGFVSKHIRNVREFGDAGTGVDATTNTITLQAAFDGIDPGDTLYCGEGRYDINATIVIPARFVLKGSGDRSIFSWVGAAGGTMMTITDGIWTIENIEFQAPGANKPLHYISQLVISLFCTMNDVYFADECTGAAVLFGFGWREFKTEGVLFNGCFEGFRLVVVAEMSSNIALLSMNNTIFSSGNPGVPTGSALFILDTIGGDLGTISLNHFQYITNAEPIANSAIITIDEDAGGPFATVLMDNIQIFGTFSKTLAHFLLFVDKSTEITNIFRFKMENILILNGGVTLDQHIGGAFPPHVSAFPKQSILHSVSWFQNTDITIVDNELHFKTSSSVGNRDILKSSVEVESNPRMRIEQIGDIFWSDGGSSGDVRLYRGAAAMLATDTELRVGGRYRNNDVDNLADSATPNVAAGNVWRTVGTTTITDFLGGAHSHQIVIIAETSITITHGASTINLQGSVNFDMVAGNTLSLVYDGTDWFEAGRKTN